MFLKKKKKKKNEEEEEEEEERRRKRIKAEGHCGFSAPLWGVVAVTAVVLGHCIASGVLTMHNHYPPGIYAQVQSNNTK